MSVPTLTGWEVVKRTGGQQTMTTTKITAHTYVCELPYKAVWIT